VDRPEVGFRDVLEDERRPARFGEVEVLSSKTDGRRRDWGARMATPETASKPWM